jgi:hypothetical protein
METSFPMGDGPEEHEEFIKDFIDAACGGINPYTLMARPGPA